MNSNISEELNKIKIFTKQERNFTFDKFIEDGIFSDLSTYRLIKKLGEGTFSEVFKAQSLKTGTFVAIKCMKNSFNSIEQVNNLREVQALRRLQGHKNIIKLIEVLL